jgi:hypothetical protein
MYFWMQEPKAEHDDELVARFNDSMNAFAMEDGVMQVNTKSLLGDASS